MVKKFKSAINNHFPEFSRIVYGFYLKAKYRFPKSQLIPRPIDNMAWAIILHNRFLVASSYLRGTGIEVGALDRPLKMPSSVRVRYVDRYSLEGLYKNYPEMLGIKIVSPDIVDDGEKLAKFPDSQEDFLVSNHFLEHSQDPIGTLINFLRVIKSGGILYLSIPDKRFTYDVNIPITTFEHLVEDHEQGPEKSKEFHYRQFVRLGELHCGTEAWKTEEEYEAQVQKLMRENYSIHFHAWDYMATIDFFLSSIRRYNLPCEIIFSMSNIEESLWILKKN